MRAKERFIFVVTHLFPYPPSHGTELRILKLMKGLKALGYQVVLVLNQQPDDQESLAQLNEFLAAVHWPGSSWRTRVGRRFPRLRRLVWENVKPLLPSAKMTGRSAPARLYQQIPSGAGDAWKKRAVIPPELVFLVSKLARRYRPLISARDVESLINNDLLHRRAF